MVLAIIKVEDSPQFLVKTESSILLADFMTNVTGISNGIFTCTNFLKDIESWGYESTEKDKTTQISHPIPSDATVEAVKQICFEVKSKISPENVEAGKTISKEAIREVLLLIRGAFKLLEEFPEASGKLNKVNELVESGEYDGPYSTAGYSLWFASKELQLDKKLSDYIGTNEKTKVVLRLHPKSQGIPTREISVSKEEQTRILLESFRRQQELARLETDESSGDPEWSDPQSLRRAMQGISNISWHR